MAAVLAERSLLASLLGGCLAPVAAHGTVVDYELTLRARVLSVDGQQQINGSEVGSIFDAVQIGARLAHRLSEKGAAQLIATARSV
jgi:hydroxymethylbilane synthase